MINEPIVTNCKGNFFPTITICRKQFEKAKPDDFCYYCEEGKKQRDLFVASNPPFVSVKRGNMSTKKCKKECGKFAQYQELCSKCFKIEHNMSIADWKAQSLNVRTKKPAKKPVRKTIKSIPRSTCEDCLKYKKAFDILKTMGIDSSLISRVLVLVRIKETSK